MSIGKLCDIFPNSSVAGVLLLSAGAGAITWPYAINEWLVYAGNPATVTWWHGALLGMIPYIGWSGILAAAVTFVCMMFLN